MDIYTLVEKCTAEAVNYTPSDEWCKAHYLDIDHSDYSIPEDAKLTGPGQFQYGAKNSMYGKTLTAEHKRAIGNKAREMFTGVPKHYKTHIPIMKGSDNPRARQVYAEGKIYNTIKECCEAYNMKNHNAIRYRCNHNKWTEWKFVDNILQ